MENILELLCDLPLPLNRPSPEADEAHRKNWQARMDLMDRLQQLLNPEQTALLNAYRDLGDAEADDLDYRKFVYGFHLGAALTMEILLGRQQLRGK